MDETSRQVFDPPGASPPGWLERLDRAMPYLLGAGVPFVFVAFAVAGLPFGPEEGSEATRWLIVAVLRAWACVLLLARVLAVRNGVRARSGGRLGWALVAFTCLVMLPQGFLDLGVLADVDNEDREGPPSSTAGRQWALFLWGASAAGIVLVVLWIGAVADRSLRRPAIWTVWLVLSTISLYMFAAGLVD